MNKKSAKGKHKEPKSRVPGGVSGVADSDYQIASEIDGSYLELLERLQNDYAEVSRSAREALQGLFSRFISRLLKLATLKLEPTKAVKTSFGSSSHKRKAKAWAGKMLASIGETIRKHDTNLCKVNAGYRDEQKKIRGAKQLGQVIVSPKPIMETVQRELRRTEDHRQTLRQLQRNCGRGWEEKALLLGIPGKNICGPWISRSPLQNQKWSAW